MGSSREMTISAIAEPAMMLAIFTVAITAGSTDLSQIAASTQGATGQLLEPAPRAGLRRALHCAAGGDRAHPGGQPGHPSVNLTMIHEAMLLEYSGRYLAFMEWGAAVKQLVLMTLLVNVFFPIGLAGPGPGRRRWA